MTATLGQTNGVRVGLSNSNRQYGFDLQAELVDLRRSRPDAVIRRHQPPACRTDVQVGMNLDATRGKFMELLGRGKGIDIVKQSRHEKRSRYVEWEGMAESKEARDEDLLRRMAAGDEEAFGLFYGRHSGAIYRFALHMTGRKEAAEEVVQEAFMTLIQIAGKFDAERGEPGAFLYGIARNHVRRVLEREGQYELLTEEENLASEAIERRNGSFAREDLLGELTRSETVEQVRRAVTTLPSVYREAVTLCDLQGRDYASAAKILECPIGTVRSRLARGREMLSARLRCILVRRKKAAEGSRCA